MLLDKIRFKSGLRTDVVAHFFLNGMEIRTEIVDEERKNGKDLAFPERKRAQR